MVVTCVAVLRGKDEHLFPIAPAGTRVGEDDAARRCNRHGTNQIGQNLELLERCVEPQAHHHGNGPRCGLDEERPLIGCTRNLIVAVRHRERRGRALEGKVGPRTAYFVLYPSGGGRSC